MKGTGKRTPFRPIRPRNVYRESQRGLPSSSWWLQADRQTFSERAKQRMAEGMNESREAAH